MNFVPKTEEQLAWDLVKVTARSMINVEVAEYRNRRLNEVLGELWPQFQASLHGEVPMVIDAEFGSWVSDALENTRAIERV